MIHHNLNIFLLIRSKNFSSVFSVLEGESDEFIFSQLNTSVDNVLVGLNTDQLFSIWNIVYSNLWGNLVQFFLVKLELIFSFLKILLRFFLLCQSTVINLGFWFFWVLVLDILGYIHLVNKVFNPRTCFSEFLNQLGTE